MSAKINCYLITHGDLGEYLIKISSNLVTNTVPIAFYSNKNLALEKIEEKISSEIASKKSYKHLVFVDLAGGSCWMLANRIKKNNDDVSVISGVNIPMLVSFQVNCCRMEWEDLLVKIVEDGKKGIDRR
ncbi:MAG: hypothetical protein JXR46_04750 [Calditrichaceae bacterium]|nr:hypothetical protein [Calditrichaceae bacterium]MBN2708337.1 hypothetical protein [Calditrichaceae bacterium]RQV95226.1 MAG: hypothetical protein EH224_08080 [Calditrichota bacterium]